MFQSWRYSLSPLIVRGLVVPGAIAAWVAIMMMAATQKSYEANGRASDVLADLILAGHQ